MKIPLLVIVGPTASGKSDLAVQIAQSIRDKDGTIAAEIISADSRQVYRHLDIGTGKITQEEMGGVPHHLIDVTDPHERFTAMDWKKLAEEAIADIHSRGKLPIVCGGTGFYISALIDDLGFPDVETDTEEQKALEKKSAEELFSKLKKLDPRRAKEIQENGSNKNKRRLARAIVIARKLGSVPPIAHTEKAVNKQDKYDVTMIGVALPDAALKERIKNRLLRHLEIGMVEETRQLHEAPQTSTASPASGGIDLSYERMDELGLEYKYIAQYLQGKITKEKLPEILATKIWQYARRQKTWWKKDTKIKWLTPQDKKEVEKIIKTFLDK